MSRKIHHFIVSIFLTAAFGLTALPADSHDFWMQPSEYTPRMENPHSDITLRVGHATEALLWRGRSDRIERLNIVTGGNVTEYRSKAIKDLKSGEASFAVNNLMPGSHIIQLDTNDTFIELESEKFQTYIRQEGLSAIIADREGNTDKPGRELYSRNAKTLIQVGTTFHDVTQRIGQRLELVPVSNPASLSPGEELELAVYYEGKPASGVAVHLESLTTSVLPERTQISDTSGIVSFDIPMLGAWKVDAVWGEPIKNDPRADYRTVFSSLTFSFD